MSKVPFYLEFPKKQISSVYYSTKLTGGSRLRLSLGVSIETKFWDAKKYRVRIRKEYPECEVLNLRLDGWEKLILETLNEFKVRLITPINETFKKAIIDKLTVLNNDINNIHSKSKVDSLTNNFYSFLEERRISEGRIRAVKVVIRAFRRFELYKDRSFTFDSFTTEDVKDFERFLVDEHKLHKKFPHIYDEEPENAKEPQQRSRNRIACMMKILISFFNQAIEKRLIASSPFASYTREQEVYGTPYFITIQERDILYKLDLSKTPALAIQRDIFIFQCLIGCRVGDLMKMTKDNVMDGTIEYIARKTKEDKPETVVVPLSKTALEILERYPEVRKNKLLPFINAPDYNDAIKEFFTLAELTRMVTILDPKSREEVKKPLNEVASSHLARRTFIGTQRIKRPR